MSPDERQEQETRWPRWARTVNKHDYDAMKAIFGSCSHDPEWLRAVMSDGEPVVYARCPGCGEWGQIDNDQLHGTVSTHHDPGCGWHETKDWWTDHVACGPMQSTEVIA